MNDSEAKMLLALVHDAVVTAAEAGVSHSSFHGFRIDAWRKVCRLRLLSIQVQVTYGVPPSLVGGGLVSIPR